MQVEPISGEELIRDYTRFIRSNNELSTVRIQRALGSDLLSYTAFGVHEIINNIDDLKFEVPNYELFDWSTTVEGELRGEGLHIRYTNYALDDLINPSSVYDAIYIKE